jgi:hypothetical protein
MTKEYTHAKGFNVTSLKGVVGLYFFQNSKGEVLYIGMCNDDFKNRIYSHDYGDHGKLSPDIIYLRVIFVNPVVYPLHVLEHLFIWYFNPKLNNSLWFFGGNRNERELKHTAKEHNLYIQGSLKSFIHLFESILIEREWDENSEYKKYGEIEHIGTKKVSCIGTHHCLCFQCLVNSRY